MYRLLITLTAILFFSTGYSQKVEGIKKGSGSHSGSSGSKSGSGNQSSGSSSGYSGYSGGVGVDPACLIDGCSILFNIFSNMETRDERPQQPTTYKRPSSYNETPEADSIAPADTLKKMRSYTETPEPLEPPANNRSRESLVEEEKEEEGSRRGQYEWFYFTARGSFYPADYRIFVPELTGSIDPLSYSVRFFMIAEERLDKTDYYSTLDFQPLQVNFVNRKNVLWKMGIGGMAETFSSKVYFEFTTNVKWRMGSKFDAGIEGRMATQNGVVRREVSAAVNYAIWQKSNKQFLVGINGMSAQYYQTVNIDVVSVSTGFRF